MAAFLAERLGYTTLRQYCSLIERSNTLDRDINTLHRFIDCDRALRTVFMKWIGVFESQFKARYANAMAREHGPFAHRDPSNFKNSEHFDDFLETYSREFSYKLEAGNESVKTAFERDGDLPIWRAVEILPLGALSKMHRNSVSENVRFKVADAFRVKYGMLSSWLRTISEIRNRCAHFEPFVCKPVTFKPKRMPGITADNGSIFYIVLILEQLTQTDALHEDIRTTYDLGVIKDVLSLAQPPLEDILPLAGFPANWKDEMAIASTAINSIEVKRAAESDVSSPSAP